MFFRYLSILKYMSQFMQIVDLIPVGRWNEHQYFGLGHQTDSHPARMIC